MEKRLAWIVAVGLLGLAYACSPEQIFSGPNAYEDGFEAYENAEELIEGENLLWSFFQLTIPENTISVDSEIVYAGDQSLRFEARASDPAEGVSKASLNKQFMAFWEGEVVELEALYYIVGTDSLDWLFLMDLEEKVSVGAGPGMRIALVEDAVVLEHKYPNPNIFPANRKADFLSSKYLGKAQV